ncbi:tRNA threonylcarbamoyladenosine dehydratase isoform X2 [Panicum miliaceum]|uniref:tRNA threonylcarbamoyladenosine dehydratase isoform X2 n=1 Tax=Panicum miliaceum TaxID=4540 RepID=A0A3L6RWW1_PANMI|nr:tRNA threonylcarbamoyladenosine dehydratase isoform X2 [Panicum miliaceum]
MGERAKEWLLAAGAGAAIGALSAAAVMNSLSRSKRREGYVRELLESNGVTSGNARSSRQLGAIGSSDLLSDEVVSEQLTRNIQFFGMDSQKKVTESYVVVIGLGGVGSHAASMLLRSGVGRLLLVDFDQVSLSSLNRHAVATRDDVGTPKALCLKKHFSMIYPECQIDARVQLYDPSSEADILSGQPDFVLDCIDNIDTKVRYRLKKEHGIEGGIPVVFSLEKPKAKLLPFQASKEEETPSDYQIVPGFRVRIIPVLGTIPAIFGQVMASYVATQLAGLDFQTEPVINLDLDHYCILHQRLIEHEELIYGTAEQVLVDAEEIMYVVKELWRGRSARDQNQKDTGRKMWRSVNELMLVRWDKSKPAGVSNLILLKFSEADAHESTTLDHIREKEPEFYSMVSRVLKRAEVEFAL